MSTTSGAAIGTIAATPARRDFRIPLGPRLAPPLSAPERRAHRRRAAMTGSLVFIIIIVALAVRLLAGG